jgi:formylglycine-generating enzyme required for sulfatase activity
MAGFFRGFSDSVFKGLCSMQTQLIPCSILSFCVVGLFAASPAMCQEKPVDMNSLLKTFSDEFVEITPGKGKFPASFVMGTDGGREEEAPAHKVTFAVSFHMAKYEIPQNLYEAVMGSNPSKWKGKRNSAEMFTWDDANEFCKRATKLMREAKLLAADEEVRLPTEAEWEYCCRAGTSTAYHFGDEATRPGDAGNKASILDEYGWHTGNAAGNDPPVGAKKPNAWGLYDMHGYLWEFVSDAWHDSYEGAPADGSARTSGDAKPRRIVRGGSWKDKYDLLRSASRRSIAATSKDDAIGFRCVKAKVK